jgi:hypothetical protein
MRGCKVIGSFDDMVTEWYISAGLESLLLVLLTVVATLRAYELLDSTSTLDLLYRAIRKADLHSCEDLEARLKRWRWLKDWHPMQIQGIWSSLYAFHTDLVPFEPGYEVEAPQDPQKTRDRWFLGELEFFNSFSPSRLV